MQSWKLALAHAAIVAGGVFFTALGAGLVDGKLDLINLEVAAIGTGGTFFASLKASSWYGGTGDVSAPPPASPPP